MIFSTINMPPREMLLNPILPERSLAMLYAPRGVGKTLLALSIGLAVASGSQLLRWRAYRQRRVLYVDGEMPLVSLQERLRSLSAGLGGVIPNDGFRILAADNTDNGLSIGSEEGQRRLNPLLSGVDLVTLDNLSTLCTNGSESASDAWVPMQNWLLKLRRQGVAVLLVHHAGTNGRQRGTSRREDALDTVIACADLRITRLNKALDSKCISRSFGIAWTVTLSFRLKRNLRRFRRTKQLAFNGSIATYVRPC
jgi:putative DNA primase/helicase